MRAALLILPVAFSACMTAPAEPSDPADPGSTPITPTTPSTPVTPGSGGEDRGGTASIALPAEVARVTLTRVSQQHAATEATQDADPRSALVLQRAKGETLAVTLHDSLGRVLRTALMGPGELNWAAAPRTLSVPRDHATIQAAIDAAAHGDTVLVAPGVYGERVRLKTGVRLQGDDARTTILDGELAPCTATPCPALIDFSETHDVVISGFTLRRSRNGEGCADPGDPFRCSGNWYTPAIYADGHLSDPLAYLDPARATSALISGNIIEDNGVGVMLYFHAHAVVRSNIFVRNDSALVANHFQSHSLIANNVFWENGRMAVGNQSAYLDIVSNIFGRTANGNAIEFEYVQRGRIRCNIHVTSDPLTAVDDDLFGDPGLVDPAAGDFRLREDSPALAAGCLAGEDIGASGGPMGAEAPL